MSFLFFFQQEFMVYQYFHLILHSEPSILLTNGRPRVSLQRRSPGSSHSQPQSQSSSEMALSIGRTDSGRTYTTDLSEASTIEDYITANASIGTGTASATTTSSWSKAGHNQLSSSTAPSGPTSTTTTAADGSSFESASSIYSLARSEVNQRNIQKSFYFIF